MRSTYCNYHLLECRGMLGGRGNKVNAMQGYISPPTKNMERKFHFWRNVKASLTSKLLVAHPSPPSEHEFGREHSWSEETALEVEGLTPPL